MAALKRNGRRQAGTGLPSAKIAGLPGEELDDNSEGNVQIGSALSSMVRNKTGGW